MFKHDYEINVQVGGGNRRILPPSVPQPRHDQLLFRLLRFQLQGPEKHLKRYLHRLVQYNSLIYWRPLLHGGGGLASQESKCFVTKVASELARWLYLARSVKKGPFYRDSELALLWWLVQFGGWVHRNCIHSVRCSVQRVQPTDLFYHGLLRGCRWHAAVPFFHRICLGRFLLAQALHFSYPQVTLLS